MGKNIQGSSIIRSERQKMKSPSITWLKNIYSAPSQSSFIIINTMQQVSCKYPVRMCWLANKFQI